MPAPLLAIGLRTIVLFAVLSLAINATTFSGLAQTPAAADATATPQASPPSRKAAIAALVKSIQSLRDDIAEIESKLGSEQPGPIADELKAQLKAARKSLEDKRFDLLNVATEVDLSDLESVEVEAFSLQHSLEELVRPLVEEIKRATEDTRATQQLRDQFETAKERGAIVGEALESLDRTISSIQDKDSLAELSLIREQMQKRYENLNNEISVLGFQLEEIDSKKRSLLSQTGSLASRFFRTRGRNLVLALGVAVAVLIGLRYLRNYLHEKTGFMRKDRSTTARLIDVALYFAAVLGAIVAALIVLFIVGDWVLIGLVSLILIGLVLSTKDTLPGYADEIRLILNVGSVRERERIVYNGVPWLVERLSFFSTLRNPVLRGGMVRMPVGQLVGMISRPVAEREPYFPCEEGDWVLLDDETFGRVIFQSTEMVRIVMLGGAQKTYSTETFLGQNPRNISHDFRIRTTIGIDYSHQPLATGEILERLKAYYQNEIYKLIDHSHVHSINVDFSMANASSLDYEVLLDVDGDLAPRFQTLTRALQRIGVDACNKFGLVIPFQQVTIHRGATEEGTS